MIHLKTPFLCAALIAASLLCASAQTPNAPSKAALPQNASPNQLSPTASLALVLAERDKYWLNAKHEIYKSPFELIAQHATEFQRGFHFKKLIRGNPKSHQIALTFDDGPHPAYTPEILRILKENNIKATFFVVGEQAEKFPNLIRAENADGHNIGNHTYDHVSLIKIPDQYVGTEIKACGEVIEQITGKAPHLFRPPGGEYDPMVAQIANDLGYTMILWSDDPGDYASPGTYIIETRTLDTVSNGGVILLHDGIQQTIDTLPTIIKTLKARGYEFITMDEMLKSDI